MIETKWEELQNKLEASRSTLSHYHDLMSLFADMNDCLADIAQIEVRFLLSLASKLLYMPIHAF